MKKIIIIATLCSLGIISGSTYPGANTSTGPNSVYIQQLGSSNTIAIEQVGGTNRVGGVTNTTDTTVDANGITTLTPADPGALNYGTISGSSNALSITQHGNDNSAQYNIQGTHNSYSSSIIGNDNQTALTVGDKNHASNNYNNVLENVIGSSNLLITNIVGTNNTLNTSITGSTNQVTQNVNTSNGNINNVITGGNNVFNIQQIDAAGANGHVFVSTTVGDYNSITTQQQGTNDTTINLNTVGSYNTITVRTTNATIVNPMTAIQR